MARVISVVRPTEATVVRSGSGDGYGDGDGSGYGDGSCRR
jgi:hypothetical protein